jgi:hypothetical protein
MSKTPQVAIFQIIFLNFQPERKKIYQSNAEQKPGPIIIARD